MRIIVCGEIATGKDYAVKNIIIPYLESKGLHLTKGITDTTRPIRKGEVDGVHYNFITENEFRNKILNGGYLEYQTYSTPFGNWLYGTNKDSLEDNTIFILDKVGFLQYKNMFPDTKCIFLTPFDESERFYRALNRLGENVTSTDVQEVWRRISTDRNKFADIYDFGVSVIPQFYDGKTKKLIEKELDEWLEIEKDKKNL